MILSPLDQNMPEDLSDGDLQLVFWCLGDGKIQNSMFTTGEWAMFPL